jgi:hypothetical protein
MRLIALAVLPAAVAVPSLARTQTLPPAAEQIAAAVLPLPPNLRTDATVLGYRTANRLDVLRTGTNGMTCLALYVTRTDFHVACYHDGLEPFMARGRELRAQGITQAARVDSARYAEIESGKLKMPPHGVLYSLTSRDKSAWNPSTGTATGATQLTVMYMPFATGKTTGFSETPAGGGPWLMNAGTAKAHVMMVGAMGGQ